jgi:predicted Fe-Mo cluster-binding NifX family protein
VDEKVDVVLAGGMGEGPLHLLRDNLVQIFVLPEQVELEEAIRLLNENKLERMTALFEKKETDDGNTLCIDVISRSGRLKNRSEIGYVVAFCSCFDYYFFVPFW